MRSIDVAVIVVYMAVLVGVGVRLARRQKTTGEYFLARRRVPGWAIGMSLLATIITSVTFIAYPGAAYAGDWSLLVPGIMFVLVVAGIGIVVVPFFRHILAGTRDQGRAFNVPRQVAFAPAQPQRMFEAIGAAGTSLMCGCPAFLNAQTEAQFVQAASCFGLSVLQLQIELSRMAF